MKKIIHRAKRMTIGEFADCHGLVMELWNRSAHSGLPRWTARFHNTDTKEHRGSGVLTCTYGNGDTQDEAIADYARQITGKLLIVNPGCDRREIWVDCDFIAEAEAGDE